MKIQNILLDEKDMREAVSDYLFRKGLKVTVSELKKAYGYEKKGFEYEAVIVQMDDTEPATEAPPPQQGTE